ncbi:MAG: hypothetical protein ACYC7D_04470 [Nitrososphaerales archaeon]
MESKTLRCERLDPEKDARNAPELLGKLESHEFSTVVVDSPPFLPDDKSQSLVARYRCVHCGFEWVSIMTQFLNPEELDPDL